jgi:hypothetical protein
MKSLAGKTLRSSLLLLAFTPAAWAEDRLILTADGVTLTDTDGGAGGSIGWLHNFGPKVVVGASAEYQTLADAQWAFGTLSGALTGGPDGKKWSVYGDARKGSGDDDAHDFTYQSALLGVSLPLYRRLSLQIEDKQIDIDTTHGNLPKAGLTFVWTPRLQTAVSYAHSISGNLGTELTQARLDYYGKSLHFITGAAFGPANTVVLGDPSLAQNFPDRSVRQGFLGFSRAYSRAEFLMLGDYLKIGDSERVTLTLSCMIHLNPPEKPK